MIGLLFLAAIQGATAGDCVDPKAFADSVVKIERAGQLRGQTHWAGSGWFNKSRQILITNNHVAAKLEHSMLNTGLTYCGHPLACAAGVAAIAAYEDEKLIERSRVLGARMLRRTCSGARPSKRASRRKRT